MKIFLDDLRVPQCIYPDDKDWIHVKTVEEVIDYLKTGEVTDLSLDNDLGLDQREGHEVVKWMIENNTWPSNNVFVHSANIIRAKQMKEDIIKYFKKST